MGNKLRKKLERDIIHRIKDADSASLANLYCVGGSCIKCPLISMNKCPGYVSQYSCRLKLTNALREEENNNDK